jgi:hypothetical protein
VALDFERIAAKGLCKLYGPTRALHRVDDARDPHRIGLQAAARDGARREACEGDAGGSGQVDRPVERSQHVVALDRHRQRLDQLRAAGREDLRERSELGRHEVPAGARVLEAEAALHVQMKREVDLLELSELGLEAREEDLTVDGIPLVGHDLRGAGPDEREGGCGGEQRGEQGER